MNPLTTLTHRNLATLDLVIIGVYFVIVFAIGLYFARKERSSTDYFLASRNVSWFFIGASLFVSNISTEHFIGLSGTGASSGLSCRPLGPEPALKSKIFSWGRIGASLGNFEVTPFEYLS